MSDDNLRALIQLIPPARALKKELDRLFSTDEYEGLGGMALRNLKGLTDSVVKLTDNPYVATLAPDLPDDAPDKEKLAAALLAVGQLIAFLEGQAGIPGPEDRQQGQKHENVHINFAHAKIGNMAEGFEKMGETFSRLFDGGKFEEIGKKFEEAFGKREKGAERSEPPKPPDSPTPPTAARGAGSEDFVDESSR